MPANRLRFVPEDARITHKRIVQIVLVIACTLIAVGCGSVTQNSQSSHALSGAPISLQTAIPAASVGKAYNAVISVSGGSAPYWFTVTEGQLPAGLALNETTGGISGTPTQANQASFTITVRGNGNSSGSHVYTIAVSPCVSCVTIAISPLNPTITPGAKIQFAAAVTNTSNSAVTWSASAGTINSNGLFTAPASISSPIIITATSAAQESAKASTTLSFAVSKLAIMNNSLPPASVGSSYDVQLAGSGGQPPYKWSLATGALPSGLQLASSTGTLAGTATQSGSFALGVSIVDAMGHTAQQAFSLAVSGAASNCGPPNYCSRTDTKVVQLPPAPKVGNLLGANTIVTDPDFSSRIVRVTDWNTDPGAGPNRAFVSSASGSADENVWNLDSTMFIVNNLGGAAYPFTFNPSTLQASRMYVSANASTGGLKLSEAGTWSRTDPNVLYSASGTQIYKYDFSDRTNAPSPVVFYDFTSSAHCLPAGFNVTWQSRGGISGNDSVIAMGYSNAGNQGTGIYAVVYKAGSGCTMLNTQTGKITGDWGVSGTINITDRWTIHNVKLSKDGNWLIIAPQTCTSAACSKGPYFWQVGTTTVNSCGEGGHCSGHWTEGYSHWENYDNSPIGNQVLRPMAQPAGFADLSGVLPPGLGAPLDQHQSWNNVDPSDNVPFLASTWSSTAPFPAPWYNEIIGVSVDGSGKVWRFAHSFITAKSQRFSTKYAIGSVSQDGRFFLLSSDWMGTLGSEKGSESCTVGVDCRGDVFVIELK